MLLALASAIKPQDVALLPVALLLGGFPRAAAYWLAATAVLGALFAVVIGATGIGTYLAVLESAASGPGFTAIPLIEPFGPQASLLVGEGIVLLTAIVMLFQRARLDRVEPAMRRSLFRRSRGVLCAQGPAVGIRIPIVLWQPIWLVILTLGDAFTAGARQFRAARDVGR